MYRIAHLRDLAYLDKKHWTINNKVVYTDRKVKLQFLVKMSTVRSVAFKPGAYKCSAALSLAAGGFTRWFKSCSLQSAQFSQVRDQIRSKWSCKWNILLCYISRARSQHILSLQYVQSWICPSASVSAVAAQLRSINRWDQKPRD